MLQRWARSLAPPLIVLGLLATVCLWLAVLAMEGIDQGNYIKEFKEDCRNASGVEVINDNGDLYCLDKNDTVILKEKM